MRGFRGEGIEIGFHGVSRNRRPLRLSLPPAYLSVLAVVGMTTLAPAQAAPWPLSPFSTHDWTDPSTVLPESCADVKTPGNGCTYMVGTIGVTNTVPSITNPPMFSGTQIASPPVNLQIGPPLANPIAIAGMPGVEVWTTNSPVFTYYAPHDGTLRVPLWPTGLPSGSWTFALQFFAAYPGSYPFAATPALVITY